MMKYKMYPEKSRAPLGACPSGAKKSVKRVKKRVTACNGLR